MTYLDGYSVNEMMGEYLGIVDIQNTDADGKAEALRALNSAQLAMFGMGDWPALKLADCYFVTDGSTFYDLTTDILKDADGNAITGRFGRMIVDTLRVGTRPLYPVSRGKVIQHDPALTGGSIITNYAIPNKKQFFPYSVGSSGDTVQFDIVGLPVKLEENMAASAISFEPQDHWLIVEGSFLLGMRSKRKSDWTSQYKVWEDMVKGNMAQAKPMRSGTTSFIPPKI